MAEEKKTNNPNPDSNEQPEVEAGVDYDSDFEALQKKVKGKEPVETPEVTQEKVEEEPVSQETEKSEEEPKEEAKTEEEKPEELKPEDTEEERITKLKGKTTEELAKMYINLQKLQSKQAQELGELRKTSTEQVKEEVEKVDLSEEDSELVEGYIDKMSPEEANQFLESFTENPRKAILPLIKEAMKPLRKRDAKMRTQETVQQLKESTKEDLVPYEKYEGEINSLLNKKDQNGRRVLFSKYGIDAYEKAYQQVYNKHFREEQARVNKEIEEQKKKAELASKKKKTFTESPSSSSPNEGKEPNPNDLDFESLRDKVVPKEERDRFATI